MCIRDRNIAVRAKAGNLPGADRGDDRCVTEFVPGMDVGEMDLDARFLHSGNCVPDGITVVGIGASVENNAVIVLHGLMDFFNDAAFIVGLKKHAGQSQTRCV